MPSDYPHSLLNVEMFVRNAGYLFAKTIHCPFLFVKAKFDTFVKSLGTSLRGV